ncbi:uncharacterized protein AMSG_05809 [Thecamonas trahens ATCC 50062]|uniref:Uncharacterized protein n=1 Tax=Thecamonas trahens ATCC 50062 TaxID=461836 RepID=A0A0L0DFF7_THETB|nr:hypothetical protein AMSG_05809 [Thecamonas trahens ATCC 50062]KNC50048.1 hypothetical protein AMSG_05809 [Thecamonas trahens ATCC 50062]|eukprot:XP_013757214.1 hypothetical protein AMSG_05809 [Thecamonas trahens ATCC 50062]
MSYSYSDHGRGNNGDYYSYYYSDEDVNAKKLAEATRAKTVSKNERGSSRASKGASQRQSSSRAAGKSSSARKSSSRAEPRASSSRQKSESKPRPPSELNQPRASFRETVSYGRTEGAADAAEPAEKKAKCKKPVIKTQAEDGTTLYCGTTGSDWIKVLISLGLLWTFMAIYFWFLFTVFLAVEFPNEL